MRLSCQRRQRPGLPPIASGKGDLTQEFHNAGLQRVLGADHPEAVVLDELLEEL